MKTTKIVAFLGVVAMSAVLVYGFGAGDFFKDGGEIISNPWGIVSLVDLYTGFILFSLWIIYREKNMFAKLLWVLAMMIFGFLTGAVYVLYVAIVSKNDILTFFLGHNKENVLE